jgi:hypothetical protein
LQSAKAKLEARQRESQAQRRQQAKGVDPEEPSPPSCPPRGGHPGSKEAEPVAQREAKRTINLVDEQSRLMRDAHGVYLQGYNAQLVVEAGAESRSQLILGVHLSNDCNDRRVLAESLAAVPQPWQREITHVVADTGYDNADVIAQIEKKSGLTVLCPPQSTQAPPSPSYRLHKVYARRRAHAQMMRERLAQPEMEAIYRRRNASIEPVFGVLKNVLGFRRFRLFGLAKSKIELTLLAVAYNLRRLSQMRLAGAI